MSGRGIVPFLRRWLRAWLDCALFVGVCAAILGAGTLVALPAILWQPWGFVVSGGVAVGILTFLIALDGS